VRRMGTRPEIPTSQPQVCPNDFDLTSELERALQQLACTDLSSEV
jgi:hypothetical protein